MNRGVFTGVPPGVPGRFMDAVAPAMSRGVRWADGKTGYALTGGGSLSSIQITPINNERCFPFYLPRSMRADEVTVFLRTGQASTTCRLGWREDCEFGPGQLIVDLGTVDTSGASGALSITGTQWVIPAGISWYTVTWQGGATGPSLDSTVVSYPHNWQYVHPTTNINVNNFRYVGRGFSGVSGALPQIPDYQTAFGLRDTSSVYFQVRLPAGT